jgi:hypothetical protein
VSLVDPRKIGIGARYSKAEEKKETKKEQKEKRRYSGEERRRDFVIVCDDYASYKGRLQYLHFREKLVSQS